MLLHSKFANGSVMAAARNAWLFDSERFVSASRRTSATDGGDGGVPLMPRRPEVTGDGVDALVADLTAWVEWLVATFRLHAKIPGCWVRHPALVEELHALWFLWQHCWLPAADPTMPVAFLRELDASLSRIERHWKVPCDANEHKLSLIHI